MVETKNLSYNYKGAEPLFFQDISMNLGDSLLILGKSGTGKTTLLHLLAGLMKPTNGEIIIDNTNLSKLPSAQLDKFRGSHIGLVFQQNHFISSLNVVENLMIAQSLSNRKANSQSCLSLLDRLGLVHKARQYTHSLSQGERQRVALARAIVNDQKLILADEPTSALDDVNCSSVINLIKDHSTNACLIIVTHDSRLKDVIANQIQLAS